MKENVLGNRKENHFYIKHNFFCKKSVDLVAFSFPIWHSFPASFTFSHFMDNFISITVKLEVLEAKI